MSSYLLTRPQLREQLERRLAKAEADAAAWRETTPALATLRAMDAEWLRVQLRLLKERERP